MEHDPLCIYRDGPKWKQACPQCDLIARVRADERERCGCQLRTALPDGGTQAGLVWHGSKTDEWTMRETR